MAERFEIGVFVGQLFQIMIQLDGPPDVTVGGSEITPLGRVATQIELDQRILGMEGGGEVVEFLQCVVDHAEVGVANRAFSMLEIFLQLN